jgi:hypothetical protein
MRIAALLIVTLAAATAHADAPAPTPTPTKDDALAALTAWVKAQTDGDFTAYGALYDAKFVGIKRTSDGGQNKFTLVKWKADRKKMFKNPQKVAADGASVVIKDGKVLVDFVQRYQQGSYADHGDKELVLKAGAGGKLAIVREEMLYSAPGWDADPKAELDASALASPITAKVRQVAADATHLDDCGGVSYTLELTDAHKKKLSMDIGSGVIMVEKATDVIDADPTADKLFEFGQWCAGGADYYQIVKSGDSLVVRYKGEDEGGGEDDPAPAATWDTRLTVKVPAGAKLK